MCYLSEKGHFVLVTSCYQILPTNPFPTRMYKNEHQYNSFFSNFALGAS